MSEIKDTALLKQNETTLGSVKEINVHEIEREIIAQIAERLKDPRATELSYLANNGYAVSQGHEPADYEHGSKRRFLVLDNYHFGTDQICIAITDNRSSMRPVSRGASIRMAYEGKYSTEEISLSRFVQSPNQRLRAKNTGICYLLLLSAGVPQRLGTVSIKSEASPTARWWTDLAGKHRTPTFAERWREGEAELASYSIYDMAGANIDFQPQDYVDILKALKTGRVNTSMTQKVAMAQAKYDLAKISTRQLSSG